MGELEGILIDAQHGIEYRAVMNLDRGGWLAQWRPARALKKFMTFSYITRNERFGTRQEALDFVRSNARLIAAGEV